LLRSEDHLVYYDNYEIVPSHDSILAARDYDRTITAAIQSGHHYGTLEKQHEDRKTRIKAIMNVDDDPDTTPTFHSSIMIKLGVFMSYRKESIKGWNITNIR
jgi:hypothetical protein